MQNRPPLVKANSAINYYAQFAKRAMGPGTGSSGARTGTYPVASTSAGGSSGGVSGISKGGIKAPAPRMSDGTATLASEMSAGRIRPMPNTGPLTAPATYRGQGEFGAPQWTPARDQYLKNWSQISQEQGLTANDTTPRYGALDSVGAGMKGLMYGSAAALGNVGGTVLGKPLSWAVDNAGGALGYNPGWQEGLNDHLAALQDVRARGMHQFLYNRRSRALNDQFNATGELINATAGNGAADQAGKTIYNVSNAASELVPNLAGTAGVYGAAGRGLRATAATMGYTRAGQAALRAADKIPGPLAKAVTYSTGVPLSAGAASTAAMPRFLAYMAANARDASTAGSETATNYSSLFPAENAYWGALGAAEQAASGQLSDVTPESQITRGADGNFVVNTAAGPQPFNALAPEQAEAALYNDPQGANSIGAAVGQGAAVPNNLKSPLERVQSGTAADPYAAQQARAQQNYSAHVADASQALHQSRAGQPMDGMTAHMLQDPAIQRRIAHGQLPADAAQNILAETAEFQQAEPAAQQQALANASDELTSLYQNNAAAEIDTGFEELSELVANPQADPTQVQATTNKVLEQILRTQPSETVDGAREFLAQANPAATPGSEEAPAQASPAAAEFQNTALSNALADAQQNAPPETKKDPAAFGEYISQAVEQFQQMPVEAQAAIGLGFPLALAGVFMGGGAGTLLGLLGLVGAAGGAAYGGMFGEQAQQMIGQFVPDGTRGVGRLMAQAGRAMGHTIPEQADLSLLYKPEEGQELDPLGRVEKMTQFKPGEWFTNWMKGEKGPDLAEELNKFDQLKLLADRPDWQAIPLMMHMDPNIETSEQAREALQHARRINTAANDPQQPLHRQLATLRRFKPATTQKSSSLAVKLAGRCWKGYEPVPGKKPYTSGSCRPKQKKKLKAPAADAAN